MAGEHLGERGEGHARLGGDHLVGRGVVDQAREAAGADHRVEARGAPAQPEVGSAAHEGERQPLGGGAGEGLGRLLDGGRLEDQARDHALDGVVGGSGALARHHRWTSPDFTAGCSTPPGPGFSPQSRSEGNTLPGLKASSGSKAARTHFMVSRSASPYMSAM